LTSETDFLDYSDIRVRVMNQSDTEHEIILWDDRWIYFEGTIPVRSCRPAVVVVVWLQEGAVKLSFNIDGEESEITIHKDTLDIIIDIHNDYVHVSQYSETITTL